MVLSRVTRRNGVWMSVGCGDVLALHPRDQGAHGELADGLLVRRDGGEAGRSEPTIFDVVKSNDRNILRDPQLGLMDGADGADREQVVVGEDGLGWLGQSEQLTHRGQPVLPAELGGDGDQRGVEGQPGCGKRFLVADAGAGAPAGDARRDAHR